MDPSSIQGETRGASCSKKKRFYAAITSGASCQDRAANNLGPRLLYPLAEGRRNGSDVKRFDLSQL
jgi:hypothetical protein